MMAKDCKGSLDCSKPSDTVVLFGRYNSRLELGSVGSNFTFARLRSILFLSIVILAESLHAFAGGYRLSCRLERRAYWSEHCRGAVARNPLTQ